MYNFKEGKKRVKDILDNKLEVIENNSIPSDENFTYSNSYYGWVSAIFVDIRNSSELFSKEDSIMVSKIIRSFTSEIIEILREDSNLREIGIRGDCVYAIYTTPTEKNEYDLYIKCCFINTFMKMLNKLLSNKGFTNIKAGIGLATAQELVIKAGRYGSGINNKVWIGNAVTTASNLSSLGNKDGIGPIVVSEASRSIILKIHNKDKSNYEDFFDVNYVNYKKIYHCDRIMLDFNDWIDKGMLL